MQSIVDRLRLRCDEAKRAADEAKSAESLAQMAQDTVVGCWMETTGEDGIVFLHLQKLSGETLRLLATEQCVKDAVAILMVSK